jgi:hypothetical protein
MFFYLKPTSWTPKTEIIYAIKVDGDFHPCTYQRDYIEGNSKSYKSFIRGTGWKTSKKGYEIPVFTGDTQEELQAYLDKYGKFCLFYSITGFQLGCDDCVVWAMQQEFKVALSIGFDYVSKFTKRINELNSKIQKIAMEKHRIDVLSNTFQWTGGRYSEDSQIVSEYDLFHVKPAYSIMAYFLTKPHLDVISDDRKLEKYYKAVTSHKHMEANEGEFPVSMKQRLEFLFSKEVAKEYEAIMKEFPMS